jgi:hypothetical protein
MRSAYFIDHINFAVKPADIFSITRVSVISAILTYRQRS